MECRPLISGLVFLSAARVLTAWLPPCLLPGLTVSFTDQATPGTGGGAAPGVGVGVRGEELCQPAPGALGSPTIGPHLGISS